VKVLMICSGNICRSPMAAEYLRYRTARNGLAHVVVDSAGTLGIRDRAASAEAIETLAEIGLDLSNHRSKALMAADLRSSELVIGMARDHLEYLAHRHTAGDDERLLLRSFEKSAEPAADAPDLADPIGEPIEIYRKQFELIRTCVDHLVLYLKHTGPRTRDG
jgi:protein-tyrosine-phosphatase